MSTLLSLRSTMSASRWSMSAIISLRFLYFCLLAFMDALLALTLVSSSSVDSSSFESFPCVGPPLFSLCASIRAHWQDFGKEDKIPSS